MTNNVPKTVTVYGSGGEAQYCIVTGEAVTEPYRNDDFQLNKIDLKEYLEYWLHLDSDGIPLNIDVLDVGGWDGLGTYSPPEIDWRADAIVGRHEELMVATRSESGRTGKLQLRQVTSGPGRVALYFTPGAVLGGEEWGVIEWGEDALIGSWERIDHAYETARAIGRLLKVSDFTVKV